MLIGKFSHRHSVLSLNRQSQLSSLHHLGCQLLLPAACDLEMPFINLRQLPRHQANVVSPLAIWTCSNGLFHVTQI